LFVVGRGYGQTNLIILDAQGNTMMNADLQVVNTLPPNSVRLYNGKDRETYSCIPYCGPSPVLGDNRGFISGNTSNERELTSFPAFNATSSSAPVASGAPAGGAPINSAPVGGPPSSQNGPMPQQVRRPS